MMTQKQEATNQTEILVRIVKDTFDDSVDHVKVIRRFELMSCNLLLPPGTK